MDFIISNSYALYDLFNYINFYNKVKNTSLYIVHLSHASCERSKIIMDEFIFYQLLYT